MLFVCFPVLAQTDTPRRAKKRRSADKAANIVSRISGFFLKKLFLMLNKDVEK